MVPNPLTQAGHIPIRSEYLNQSTSTMAANTEIGSHPSIQPTSDRSQKIEHRAMFKSICFDSCDGMINRKHFTVYDNAIEWNRPYNCALLGCRPSQGIRGYESTPSCLIFVLPPNCCCIGHDEITKMHYDQDFYETRSCLWACKFLKGAPTAFPRERKWVCLCMQCCDLYNQLQECYHPACCGERVRLIPYDYCCWCIPNKSAWYCNYFGLCGLADGEPLCLRHWFVSSLIFGEAEKLAASINTAREDWCRRTNHHN